MFFEEAIPIRPERGSEVKRVRVSLSRLAAVL
jgi:hypothetical protein